MDLVARTETVLRTDLRFNGVKVFSAARGDDLDAIAATWIDQHAEVELVDITFLRSSDAGCQCWSIVLTYWRRMA